MSKEKGNLRLVDVSAAQPDKVEATVEQDGKGKLYLHLAISPEKLKIILFALGGYMGHAIGEQDEAWEIHDAILNACDDAKVPL